MDSTKECAHSWLECIRYINFPCCQLRCRKQILRENHKQSKRFSNSSNPLGRKFKAAICLGFFFTKHDLLVDRENWNFHSLQTVIFKIVLYNNIYVKSCFIIHQTEIVASSTIIFGHMGQWSRYFTQTSHTSSMEHMQVSLTSGWDHLPNDDITSSVPWTVLDWCLNSVGLMVSGVLFPLDQQIHGITL